MADPANLPYLIRLLEDDSDVVRENVLRELSSFGPFLEIELSRSNILTSDEQRHQMRNMLGTHARRWLRAQWDSLPPPTSGLARLEQAAGIIAEFQYGPGYPARLSALLDKSAAEFRKRETSMSVLSLATFLFRTRGLRGADSDYYNPFHSNLVYVLEEGRGNPLSLCCVYILVGDRAGLHIDGCNFPGHFLAKAHDGPDTYVVDCFNGGRFLEESDIARADKKAARQLKDVLDHPCSVDAIMARMIRNLIHAYRQEDKPENVGVFTDLLSTIHETTGPDTRDTGE